MTEISDSSVLAIDIGGTKIALAVVDDGAVIERVQVPTPRSGKGDDIVAAIVEEARKLPATRRAGIATTGIVDAGRLTALNPVTLPIEDRYALVKAVNLALGQPVIAVNDAQAAAWAEFRRGAGRGADRMAFITVSTGIGGGVVLDGRLQMGDRGLAGHVGHMVSDPAGPMCGCGRRGCVERLASGTAIGTIASDLLGRPMTAPDVFAAAGAGDSGCIGILDRAAASLADILCDLAASIDLDRIVMGGGVGLAPGFIGRVLSALEQRPAIFRRSLVLAEMKGDAGLIGVADLVSDGNFH